MDAASAVQLLARMFGEGHGLACRLNGGVVELPEVGLRIAVDAPDLQPNGVVGQVVGADRAGQGCRDRTGADRMNRPLNIHH